MKKLKMFLVVAVMFLLVTPVVYSAEKGVALVQLEDAAAKKIEDVKVPKVPPPTRVSSFEVSSSTTSYDVNTSTTNPKGNPVEKSKPKGK